ncbi:hypothetical protein [Paludibacterium yongneupense]|nr:hypothetical protein [Paludibacterium yongneupense]
MPRVALRAFRAVLPVSITRRLAIRAYLSGHLSAAALVNVLGRGAA